MILPSKKVFSIFIICAALVVSIIIAFGRDKASSAINYASNLVAGEKISVPENPNWQNELGQINAPTIGTNQADETAENKTLTDTVAVSLISNYLALKQSGNLDEETAQSLVDQTTDYIQASIKQTIDIPDLNIIPNNDRQTILDYGENLGNVLRKNRPLYKKSEMDIIQDALQSRDSQKLEELNLIINTFKNMSTGMKTMVVPKQFSQTHTAMIVGIDVFVSGLEEMKMILSDSLRGLNGLGAYEQGTILFLQNFKDTLVFIKEQDGGYYKQGSGGYYLLYGI